MNFNIIMSISLDQSLEVFRDSFHSFYILGFKNVKINVFGEKYFGCIFYQIEVQVLTNWSRRLKNTKHLKFDIRQIVYASLKNEKKNHIFREFKKSSVTHVKIVCGKSFTTIPHFWFHCEILTINLIAFVKDNLLV